MDINKVFLMGRLGQDPAYHKMSNDNYLCKFGLATSRRWKNKQTGEVEEETNWHNIVVFNPYLIKTCRNFLEKGTRVWVEGELKTRTYEKDGEKKYITEIIVPQIKGDLWVVEKGKGWDTNETPGAERGRGSGGGGPQPAGYAVTKALAQDYDDDIPF